MTTQEFSNEFDVLYNNIMSNAAPGLNEYEKSVFLTKAQNELVLNFFSPKGNVKQDGIDDSAIRQMDFSELIKVKEYDETDAAPSTATSFDIRGRLFAYPTDLLLPINEAYTSGTNPKKYFLVVPLSHNEYTRLMSKPFAEPLKRQVWKLIQNNVDTTNNDPVVEIIRHTEDKNSISYTYTLRYVRRPNPIILVNLSTSYDSSVKIDGKQDEATCELHPIIHRQILDRAVELAKAAYSGDLTSVVQLNQRNE